METNLTRRQFMKGLAATGLLAASGGAAYASLFEPFNYELTETEIFIRGLAPAFDGFRIAQLSDVHHSRIVSIEEVRRVVELARGLRPDMFALTGDYTTSLKRFIEPCAEALGTLEAPSGVWAVLGNHDHYTDGELTARALTRHGINLLGNANTVLRRGGDELQLLGVDDWGWGKSDWNRVLRGVDTGRPSILLSHEPVVFDMEETRGLSLVLSGHTHGGQICISGLGSPATWLWRGFRYLRGRFERADGSQLYVSRGTGMIGLPFRFGARPEIALLKLRAAS